jgi:hypothetical protein
MDRSLLAGHFEVTINFGETVEEGPMLKGVHSSSVIFM